MNNITVCIPVSPYHLDLLPQAIASVRAQTLACETLVYYDEDGKGAGFARNQLLKRVKTDLLIFLDADDQLAPTFAEKTFALHQRTGRYIYTDWQDELGEHHGAPDCVWENDTHHLITTLLPTQWARDIGGFDETLSAGEDRDFYTHLVSTKRCGFHLPETLVTYTHYGQRSKNFFAGAEFHRINEIITLRYMGKIMGCCDGQPLVPAAPLGERVLVMPTWGLGTRTVIGMATGTNYGRLDASTEPVLMDRRDVEIRPGLFRIISEPKAAPKPAPQTVNLNGNGDFKQLVGRIVGAMGGLPPMSAPRVYVPEPAAVVEGKPNVERVLRLTGSKKNAEPVFVFPIKEYPSYTDVRRLVELSGFETLTVGTTALWASDRKLIYLSPEQPYIETIAKYHQDAVWWTLEYGGEYEPSAEKLELWREYGGEVWASDPAWAKAHGAKFVVMGSHPELSFDTEAMPPRFDVTMLAYMTPRREAIKSQLVDLVWPPEIYPGYGEDRFFQLKMTRLMLHAHQDEQRRAIAPQRFALCAAYHLPLIHESVPDEGAYHGAGVFCSYEMLAQATRIALMDTSFHDFGDALYEWLCVDQTFRKSVMEALK